MARSTCRPAATRRVAAARPMPDVPPVMSSMGMGTAGAVCGDDVTGGGEEAEVSAAACAAAAASVSAGKSQPCPTSPKRGTEPSTLACALRTASTPATPMRFSGRSSSCA